MILSDRSLKNLGECHGDIQKVFLKVAEKYPFEAICGHRNKEDQDAAVLNGNSKTPWPKSPHNSKPSMAVDVCPLPINWKDREAFYHFAGYVLGVADAMGIKLVWGGDWNANKNLKDQKFFDLPHFELKTN